METSGEARRRVPRNKTAPKSDGDLECRAKNEKRGSKYSAHGVPNTKPRSCRSDARRILSITLLLNLLCAIKFLYSDRRERGNRITPNPNPNPNATAVNAIASSNFVNQFILSVESPDISKKYGRMIPFVIKNGKLLCRRSHKLQMQEFQEKGPQAALYVRSRAFIEMVVAAMASESGTPSLSDGLSDGLPILLQSGDINGCVIPGRTELRVARFPRLTWSVPAPKYGAEDWCQAVPMPSFKTWEGLADGDGWESAFRAQAAEYPWTSKIRRAVWRGGTTYDEDQFAGVELGSTPRGRLVKQGMEHPELIDAGFRDFMGQYETHKDDLSKQFTVSKHMKFNDQMKYKAILDVDGNKWSSRYPKLLCSNSVVIKIDPDYVESFYRGLDPMVHYVPASLENLTRVAAYVLNENNDGEMRKIVGSANRWCTAKMNKGRMAEEASAQLKKYRSAVRREDSLVVSEAVEDVDMVDCAG